MKHKLTVVAVAALIIAALAAPSRAESVTITLTNAVQFGRPGQTLTFDGSLSNTTASAVRVDAVRFFNPFLPFLPPTAFVPEAPVSSLELPLLASGPITLDPRQSSSNAALFRIELNNTYVGEFTRTFLVGANTPSGFVELGRTNFVFTVAPQPVPEPSTLALVLMSALAGGAIKRLKGTRGTSDDEVALKIKRKA